MTLKNVAVISGCSVATVSKVFSNSPEISDETKQKVLKAAEEVGYLQKATKRRPVLGGIKTIVLFGDNQHHLKFFEALGQAAEKKNYLLLAAFGGQRDTLDIVEQIGGLGAVVISDSVETQNENSEDSHSGKIRYISPKTDQKTAAYILQDFIDEIENKRPARIRAKKADSSSEPAGKKAKSEEIWLL